MNLHKSFANCIAVSAVAAAALMFGACGDDSSSGPDNGTCDKCDVVDLSSSSVESSQSSSSVVEMSSGSKTDVDNDGSSSFEGASGSSQSSDSGNAVSSSSGNLDGDASGSNSSSGNSPESGSSEGGASGNSSSGNGSFDNTSSGTIVDPATVVKGSMTDERDGHVYKTVKIGKQTWMAENLNYAYTASTATVDSSSFCFENDPDNCEKYGRLYMWSAVMDSAAVFSDAGKGCGNGILCGSRDIFKKYRGVCPVGWHVPSLYEWSMLIQNVGGREDGYKNLLSTTGWKNGVGTDAYGFDLKPARARGSSGRYYSDGDSIACSWTSTEMDDEGSRLWEIYYDESYNTDEYKAMSYSLRCVLDASDAPDFTVQKGTMKDSRDGKTYKTVTIGEQTWMAENLNYDVVDESYLESLNYQVRESYCYDNEASNCEKYGRLYPWDLAMVACPSGWHLPKASEWLKLLDNVGGELIAGAVLKSTSGWKNEGHGFDYYGFNALPAGESEYEFSRIGEGASFWSTDSTKYIEYLRQNLKISYDGVGAYLSDNYRGNLFSVRCLKD